MLKGSINDVEHRLTMCLRMLQRTGTRHLPGHDHSFQRLRVYFDGVTGQSRQHQLNAAHRQQAPARPMLCRARTVRMSHYF